MIKHNVTSQDIDRHQTLRIMLQAREVPIRFVSDYADPGQLSPARRMQLQETKNKLGRHFYSHLLFSLTRCWFDPIKAEVLWEYILVNKRRMEEKLERPVHITAAAYDFLSNRDKGQDLSEPLLDGSDLKALINLALRDSLTGFYNLSTFYAHVQTELSRFKRHETPFAVVIVDIDNFKPVNDRLGHVEGDLVLRGVSEAIRGAVREEDVCARWGGDEFALLLTATDAEKAMEIAGRVVAAVRWRSHQGVRVTVSAGVAGCPGDGTSVDALLQHADAAMYAAKQAGGNRAASTEHTRAGSTRKNRTARPITKIQSAQVLRTPRAPRSDEPRKVRTTS